MPFKLKTREYDRQGSRVTLRKITDYLCLRFGGVSVYLSNGGAYSEGGDSYRELPKGFFEHLEKLNPKALANVGWTEAVIEAARNGSPKPKAKPTPESLPSPVAEVNPLDPRSAQETNPDATKDEPDPAEKEKEDLLTVAQAEALTFAALSEYAAKFDIKDKSKRALIEKLEVAGYLAE